MTELNDILIYVYLETHMKHKQDNSLDAGPSIFHIISLIEDIHIIVQTASQTSGSLHAPLVHVAEDRVSFYGFGNDGSLPTPSSLPAATNDAWSPAFNSQSIILGLGVRHFNSFFFIIY